MACIRVGKLSKLPSGSVMEVMHGDHPYAVCNVDGVVSALTGVCLHLGGPLGQGAIHDGRVVCPYHMWEFDCRTGEYDRNPSLRVATHEVVIEGDEILLRVPDQEA